MFFYVAKVVWFCLQPSSLILGALMVAAWALAAGRIRLARWAVGCGLLLMVAALSPLANILLLPLEQRFARADLTAGTVTGIVVLGGGEDAPIALARHAHGLNEAGERISETVALARALPGARIVFSGGSGFLVSGGVTEGDAVRWMLLDMGVAPERLTIEQSSRDTFENARFTKALAAPAAGERWLLVTSAWHMPRAMGVFRAAGFAVEPWPVDYRTAGWGDGLRWFASPADGLRRLETGIKEYAGLAGYRLSGRTRELFPAPCVATSTCD